MQVSEDERQQLKGVLLKYADVFALDPTALGSTMSTTPSTLGIVPPVINKPGGFHLPCACKWMEWRLVCSNKVSFDLLGVHGQAQLC